MTGSCVAAEGVETLRLFQTTEAKGFREIATSGFTPHPYPGVEALDVDAAVERHPFLGLGASLTDSSAWVLSHMPDEKRERLLRLLFTKAGCNLAALRLNVGASDYSTALYSYDETPGDAAMEHFSLARDDECLFPMARAAAALHPGLFFFAAPWSPPAWMKTTGAMVGGTLRDDCMPSFAAYLAEYVRGCAERGIAIRAVSPQNETMCDAEGQYPCCTYTAEREGAFVRDHLAPAFRKAGIGAEIWVHDHNPGTDGVRRVEELLAMSGVEEAVGGVAWHCYGPAEEATNIAPLKDAHPRLRFVHTENGPHLVLDERTEWWWAAKVFGMVQNGCELFTSWNLCLDELGTPMTGAHLCAGFVTVDSDTAEASFSRQYRLFRHIGPFVEPGAHVMEVAGSRDGTRLILFRNPDGANVLVVACDGSLVRGIQRRRLVVKWKGLYKTLPLPGGLWSLSTLVFR